MSGVPVPVCLAIFGCVVSTIVFFVTLWWGCWAINNGSPWAKVPVAITCFISAVFTLACGAIAFNHDVKL